MGVVHKNVQAETAVSVLDAALVADAELVDHGAALGHPEVDLGKSGVFVVLVKPVAVKLPSAGGKTVFGGLGKKRERHPQCQNKKRKTFHSSSSRHYSIAVAGKKCFDGE